MGQLPDPSDRRRGMVFDNDFSSFIEQLPPPPYEFCSAGEILSSSSAVQDDGRIDVRLDSNNPKELESLLPPPVDYVPTPLRVPLLSWPRMNVVIQVVGSRGDVQPFIALGNVLQRRGHRVRLATHDVFESFVEKSGLEFYPIGGDPTDLMAYMVKNPGLIPSFETLRKGDIHRKRKMIFEMLNGCWESCYRPDHKTSRPFVADAIIANPPSFAHVHCAQALGVPLHLMFTMPWSATRAFPHPLANIRGSNTDQNTTNYLTYGAVELMTWQGLADIINLWRTKSLELDPVPASVGPGLTEFLNIPFTYCWSPALIPKPSDWQDHIDVCGFFFRDAPNYTPEADLDHFLRSGPPPIYIGFGSIVIDDPVALTRLLYETVRTLGIRAIISRGWSKLGDESPPDNIFLLGDCPHEWLFKHVTAVVHHGGAGTTACGLLNGCPTVIVPFFGDQPFWGSMVAAAGAGPGPIPFKELCVDLLVAAIQYCLTPEAQNAAAAMAAKIRTETGVETAADSFHAQLPITDSMRCDIIDQETAVFLYKSNQRKIRLSYKAVAILQQNHKIEVNDLLHYSSKKYHIKHERWDPMTACAASVLGTMTDVTTSIGGVFIDPYKEFKRVRRNQSSASSAGGTSRAVGTAVAKGLGKTSAHLGQGVVDFNLALVDGLYAIPKLWGEKPRDCGEVTGFKSGSAVAGKSLAMGMYDGLTGVFTEPWKGARKDGALGLAKGFAKGSIGLFAKPGAGIFGLTAYTSQGVVKSVKRSLHKSVQEQILNSQKLLARDLLNGSFSKSEVDAVLLVWDRLLR